MSDIAKSVRAAQDAKVKATANMNHAPTSSLVETVAGVVDVDEGSSWDEAKMQPLSNLYHHQIILSPSHDEDETEDEEGEAPVIAGEIVDFDDGLVVTPGPTAALKGHNEKVTEGNVESDEKDEDNCLRDDIVFDMELVGGALEEDTACKETEASCKDDDEDGTSEESSLKRSSKSSKGAEGNKHGCPVLKKAKTFEVKKDLPMIKAPQLLPKPLPPLPTQPPRKRPNCLFVNHFGTRLDPKGLAVKVNVSSKIPIPDPHRISSDESVSLKTKSTSSSKTAKTAISSGSDTKKTPIKNVTKSVPTTVVSPAEIPSEVRIVTPNVKKPITSSARIEDIHMEEDDLEPIRHDSEAGMLDSMHVPYIQSFAESANQPAAPMVACQPMMPGMMGAQHMIPLQFGNPFLQGRALFINSMQHPQGMAGQHPSSWPGFAAPGMPFSQHMNAFPGASTGACAGVADGSTPSQDQQ